MAKHSKKRQKNGELRRDLSNDERQQIEAINAAIDELSVVKQTVLPNYVARARLTWERK